MVSVKTAQLCTYSVIASVGNIKTNEHGSAPIKLYLWALKLKFYIFFTCHEMIVVLLTFFLHPFKNVKAIISLQTLQK